MPKNTVLKDSKFPTVSVDGRMTSTDFLKHCGLFTNKAEIDSMPRLMPSLVRLEKNSEW